MAVNTLGYRILLSTILVLALILPTDTLGFTISFGEKKPELKKEGTFVMTELELQSYLMSYADRFASILTQAFEDFDAQGPTLKARRFVQGDVVYSLSSVFTIAADPNPQVALLDIIVVATLGRIIYEDNILRIHGKPIEIMIKGFRQLETDIWKISSKVLTNEQQQELRELIFQWRKQNPNKVIYNYIRFSDFSAERRKSTLVKKEKTGGIFKSVQQATEQAEEMRMLAERGIFLGLATHWRLTRWQFDNRMSREAQGRTFRVLQPRQQSGRTAVLH